MEKTLQQRQLEVLEDTVKYYSEDTNRRCVSTTSEGEDGVCTYSPKSVGKENISQGCAVGRLLPDSVKEDIDLHHNPISYQDLVELEGYDLPEEVLSLGTTFLTQLQQLHDTKEFWGERQGLTPQGEVKVDKIKAHFKLE